MCVRFEALYDLTRNVFRETGQKFLAYNVDALAGKDEMAAFLSMGQALGYSAKAVKKAYAAAQKEELQQWREKVRAEQRRYQSEGLKILLVAHSYVIEDPYIGKPVVDMLTRLGAIPVRADLVDGTPPGNTVRTYRLPANER